MSSFEELEKEIERVKGEFYTESGGKSTIFKKQQKIECAKQVVNKISLDVLLNRSCYIIENTNCVHIDYPVLKSFASPEIFDVISEYIIANFQHVKNTYSKLEVLLNFDGLTISGAERYKGLIETFCMKCFQSNTGFSQIVSKFVIYNSPNILDAIKHIAMPFIEENVKSRMHVILKKDSEEYIKNIMRQLGNSKTNTAIV
jgi:hypothetical protein